MACLLLMGTISFNNRMKNIPLEETASPIVQEIIVPKIKKHFDSGKRDHNFYINRMAERLGVSYDALFRIIAFETVYSFDPTITNKYNGARGVIQFTNSTSKTLYSPSGRKLLDANDLVKEYPTFAAQMSLPGHKNRYGGPVYQYLKRFGKFKSDKELFVAVFYPAAVNWSDDHELPENVQAINPGVKTIGDYYAHMNRVTMFSSKIDTD